MMAINTEIVRRLQSQASEIGMALALPAYIRRLDPQSQTHILIGAAHELQMLRHEARL